jgi:glycogen debranching enzyme
MYRGWYKGDQKERDASYHQGTVWPWLIGPYTDMFLKIYAGKKKECKALLEKTKPLLDSIRENGLGGIGEIREGDAPHNSRGCPLQAWSVAETIRSIELLRGELK